jgi:hypothetical protein
MSAPRVPISAASRHWRAATASWTARGDLDRAEACRREYVAQRLEDQILLGLPVLSPEQRDRLIGILATSKAA